MYFLRAGFVALDLVGRRRRTLCHRAYGALMVGLVRNQIWGTVAQPRSVRVSRVSKYESDVL